MTRRLFRASLSVGRQPRNQLFDIAAVFNGLVLN
jgi:hypothetical protein